MNRDKVKTIVLALLVVMSIYLTQKIWFISPLTMLQSEASNIGINQEKIFDIRKDVLRPIKFNINLGGYYVNPAFSDDIWQFSKDVLSDYFTEKPDIHSTTIDKYEEQRRLKNIEIHFGDNIPSVLISSVFGNLDNEIVRNIKEIQTILLPATANGDIYILSANSVYRVNKNDYDSSLASELFQYIEEQNYNRYYPLFADVDNDVLMPLSFNDTLPELEVDSHINVSEDSIVVEHAKSYFDRNFDFIKTIRETSGSVVFIYGYGEKSVRINNRGRLEYTEDVRNSLNTNIISSLDIAIDFVLNHSEFPEDVLLKEIQPIESNKGYYFGFSYNVNDRPLHFTDNNSHPIEVEVYGDKVRNYRSFIRNINDGSEIEPSDEMILPHKIIDDNFELIKEDFKRDLQDEDYTDGSLLNEIHSVELVYLDNLENITDQIIIPCWKITVRDIVYYFNAYDGNLVYKVNTN